MPTIGLDLGKHRFRAVEIDKTKKGPILKNFGNYEDRTLNLNLASEESISLYAQTLKAFIKDHLFTTSHVVVSLQESDVFIRVLKTPIMEAKELRNFITLGAEEYIPLPLRDVTFDVQIMGAPNQAGKYMNVLLVASKNDVLSRYVSLIKEAGLTPMGIEPKTLSLERVLGDTQDRPGASIIVNIDIASTQIIITYKGFLRFTRSIPVGGDQLTTAVEKELNIDYVQAEEYKKTYGLDEGQVEGKVYNALRPLFDQMLLEINRTKTYYTTHHPDVIINRVILSGGTALMPGILGYIANKLDVEVELSNPWRNVKISDKISHERDSLLENGPIYSTAVGLALKEV